METVLKTGYWKIMKLFYDNKRESFHFREIKRRININENGLSRYLKELENQKILKSEREGNLKKFSVIVGDRAFSLFSLFDVEKFEKLPSLRKNAVKYFLRKIKEQPIFVILFGSTAKETFTKDSDIDLFLVVNSKIETKIAKEYAESQTGINLSIFMINYLDFLEELKLKKDKVIQSAVYTGYPLINNVKFYLEVYNGE